MWGGSRVRRDAAEVCGKPGSQRNVVLPASLPTSSAGRDRRGAPGSLQPFWQTLESRRCYARLDRHFAAGSQHSDLYANRTHKEIKIDATDLPDNFFTNKVERTIAFPGSAVWSFTIVPPRDFGSSANRTSLRGTFKDFEGNQSGSFTLSVLHSTNLVIMSYRSPVNVPDAATINSTNDLSSYESILQRSLKKVVSAQLLQAENPTLTNSIPAVRN